MKIMLTVGLLALPLFLSGKAVEQTYIESYQDQNRADRPVPIAVVLPELEPSREDQTVRLRFVVDENGTPGAFAPVPANIDSEVAAAVIKAVAQWRFAPAQRDGRPVARKVVLPVNIVVEN